PTIRSRPTSRSEGPICGRLISPCRAAAAWSRRNGREPAWRWPISGRLLKDGGVPSGAVAPGPVAKPSLAAPELDPDVRLRIRGGVLGDRDRHGITAGAERPRVDD